MSKIQVSRTANGVATLIFNRPEVYNALDWGSLEIFAEQVERLVRDESIRVLIITGGGEKAFCSGGDLSEFSDYSSEADGVRLNTLMSDALQELEDAPFPTIAAINGHALGGGAEIAVACDFRVMDESAKLGFLQLSLGLTPGWGAGQRLLRLVGYSRAMQLLMMARTYTAEDLYNLGLVNDVVPENTSYEVAQGLADRIARWDQSAVHGVKSILRAGLTQSLSDAAQHERDIFPELWAADAHLDAVEAFLSRKRKA